MEIDTNHSEVDDVDDMNRTDSGVWRDVKDKLEQSFASPEKTAIMNPVSLNSRDTDILLMRSDDDEMHPDLIGSLSKNLGEKFMSSNAADPEQTPARVDVHLANGAANALPPITPSAESEKKSLDDDSRKMSAVWESGESLSANKLGLMLNHMQNRLGALSGEETPTTPATLPPKPTTKTPPFSKPTCSNGVKATPSKDFKTIQSTPNSRAKSPASTKITPRKSMDEDSVNSLNSKRSAGSKTSSSTQKSTTRSSFGSTKPITPLQAHNTNTPSKPNTTVKSLPPQRQSLGGKLPGSNPPSRPTTPTSLPKATTRSTTPTSTGGRPTAPSTPAGGRPTTPSGTGAGGRATTPTTTPSSAPSSKPNSHSYSSANRTAAAGGRLSISSQPPSLPTPAAGEEKKRPTSAGRYSFGGAKAESKVTPKKEVAPVRRSLGGGIPPASLTKKPSVISLKGTEGGRESRDSTPNKTGAQGKNTALVSTRKSLDSSFLTDKTPPSPAPPLPPPRPTLKSQSSSSSLKSNRDRNEFPPEPPLFRSDSARRERRDASPSPSPSPSLTPALKKSHPSPVRERTSASPSPARPTTPPSTTPIKSSLTTFSSSTPTLSPTLSSTPLVSTPLASIPETNPTPSKSLKRTSSTKSMSSSTANLKDLLQPPTTKEPEGQTGGLLLHPTAVLVEPKPVKTYMACLTHSNQVAINAIYSRMPNYSQLTGRESGSNNNLGGKKEKGSPAKTPTKALKKTSSFNSNFS